MCLDKGVQVSQKEQELSRRKKKKSKRQQKNQRVVQETKVQSVDELPKVDQQKTNEQPIRSEFLQPQIIEITSAQQRQHQQIINLPQVTPLEKGFQSDQSKDQQQTLEQDQIDEEMIVQSTVRDPQIFQLQSQSQRAEIKQQTANTSLFTLDQEEEKDTPNNLIVQDKKTTAVSESKSIFSKKSSNLFSAMNNPIDNQQIQSSNFQKEQNLFPTSLFQKKNINSSQFQSIPRSEQTNSIHPKPLFASSGWHTSCQNLANNPFVTNWKQGQIQQYQQKHANSFSLFEGNPFSSLRNNNSSGCQLFSQQQQKTNSFTFAPKQDQYENNFNSASLSQSSIFNRSSQSFKQKCEEGNFYKPTKSFIDNIKYTSRKQQFHDDQDLFEDCDKNIQFKRNWNRKIV